MTVMFQQILLLIMFNNTRLNDTDRATIYRKILVQIKCVNYLLVYLDQDLTSFPHNSKATTAMDPC